MKTASDQRNQATTADEIAVQGRPWNVFDVMDSIHFHRDIVERTEDTGTGQPWDTVDWWSDDPEPDADFSLWQSAQFMADLEMERLRLIFEMDPKPNPVPVYLAISFAARFKRSVPGWAASFLAGCGGRLRDAEIGGRHGDCRELLEMHRSDHMRRYLRHAKRLYAAYQVRLLEIHHHERTRLSINEWYSKREIKRMVGKRVGLELRAMQGAADKTLMERPI